jgi:hypothetical protein
MATITAPQLAVDGTYVSAAPTYDVLGSATGAKYITKSGRLQLIPGAITQPGGDNSLLMANAVTAGMQLSSGYELPVDVSGAPDPSITVFPAPLNPVREDSFSIIDALAACTATRLIRVTFTGSKLHGTANDYAEINSPAATLRFRYTGATIGWVVDR